MSASERTDIFGSYGRPADLGGEKEGTLKALAGLFSVQANPAFCQIFICKSVMWNFNILYVKWVFKSWWEKVVITQRSVHFLYGLFSLRLLDAITDTTYIFILAKDNLPVPDTKLVVANDF